MLLLFCERGIRKNVLFEACSNTVVEALTREYIYIYIYMWEIFLFYYLFVFLIMEKKLMHTFRFIF
jgi:hypothetical protein